MKRFLAILMALLAVIAVSIPSLAAGARGLSPHPAPIVLLQANGAYAKAPCPTGGTARLMVCQTDIGVLPATAAGSAAEPVTMRSFADDAPVHGIASAPHLPPPKTA